MPPGVGCGPFWDVLGGVELADAQSTQREVRWIGQAVGCGVAKLERGRYLTHTQGLLLTSVKPRGWNSGIEWVLLFRLVGAATPTRLFACVLVPPIAIGYGKYIYPPPYRASAKDSL